MRLLFVVAIVYLVAIVGIAGSPPQGSVADRTARGMAQMFDGSAWDRMAPDEVMW